MSNLSFDEQKSIVAKILDGQFTVNSDETVLTVDVDGRIYNLDDETVTDLMASGIHDRVQRRNRKIEHILKDVLDVNAEVMEYLKLQENA